LPGVLPPVILLVVVVLPFAPLAPVLAGLLPALADGGVFLVLLIYAVLSSSARYLLC